MLTRSEVHANVPAADLKRARTFYTEILGLTPTAEDEYTITFPTPSGSWFQVYETSYAGTGKHTVAQWDVEDIEAEVRQLKSQGVDFEEYDMPGVEWNDSIASVPGGRWHGSGTARGTSCAWTSGLARHSWRDPVRRLTLGRVAFLAA